MRVHGRFSGRTVSATGMARFVLRGKNSLYDDAGLGIPSMQLYGNEFSLGGTVDWMFAERWFASPTMSVRLIGGNDMGEESATVFGFGAGLARQLGENLGATGGFKLFTGSADGGNKDISGYQLTVGLTASM